MAVTATGCEFGDIATLREEYRAEMNCQIIHDSIHSRPGWTEEFALHLDRTGPIGYGSVAVAGPWRERRALYEFFIQPKHRTRIFEAFTNLLQASRADRIETQTNARLLPIMLSTFCRNVSTESILFEDSVQTDHIPDGAHFRAAESGDTVRLGDLELDDSADWVVTCDGDLAGAGGVLYHYNRPYGDVYMKIAAPFRLRGLGAYLVQELKAVCRNDGSVPAARCNVDNLASRVTLQKAGFVPCGALVSGEL